MNLEEAGQIVTFIDDIYTRLSSITRFNTRPKIVNESVAEHSYFVVLCSMLISEFTDKENITNNMKMSVLHDVEESMSGDIPAHVKEDNKKLYNEIQKVNRDMMKNILSVLPKELSEEYNDLWNECKETKTVSSFADSLSGVLYCVREEKLGNHYLSLAKKRYIEKINEFNTEEWALPFISWININYGEDHHG